MDFLDFLPDDAEITKLIIVGPYPSYEYVRSLIDVKGITKDNLYLVVDDGWNVDKIKPLLPKGHIRFVKSKLENGLVHAKMYYCCYKDNGSPRISFITGSANASNNGMKYNAESLSFYRLKDFNKDGQVVVKNYFNDLKNGKKTTSHELLCGTNGSKLFLPAIESSAKNNDSFSSWLRSGYLLYEYDKDSNFGTLVIDLNNRLPEVINWGELKAQEESKTIRIPYIEPKFVKTGNVKSLKSFAVETCMGYWISKDAYEFYQKNNSKELEKELAEYVQSVNEKNLVKVLYGKIDSVKTLNAERRDIKEDTKNAIAKCLEEITLSKLKTIVKNKLRTDEIKATDPTFKERFKSGFSKNKIPQMDDEEWGRFVESWFESCMLKGRSNRCKSKLAKKVYALVSENLKRRIGNNKPEFVKKWFLENDWGKITNKKSKQTLRYRIKSYYKN